MPAAVVFGHSMGGIVASALAVRHPELVAGLVLVDPKYSAPDEVVDEIHVVPGGHFMHQQLAGQFNALTLSWLDKWLP